MGLNGVNFTIMVAWKFSLQGCALGIKGWLIPGKEFLVALPRVGGVNPVKWASVVVCPGLVVSTVNPVKWA